ncbi:LptF/LptG family permease [Shimia abyssi]|uniref:Lipopolysaccharide export LptBFGC system permease protein LptF n=1 Tax=Shimia abyssi TaxID=1662395 RepID=A0A2P8FAL5_9RHOB|nr:LptF/LptG family permease [Shimia abyssi]PSL18738.1 lipopolysaccharide export LptBFGC system permease protein LptF [Shimia abyssi]
MRVFGPIVRVLGFPILRRLLVILLGVEAIFLAESFTTLMEEALRLEGSAADVSVLLVFKMPEILDLALAIGFLIAVYFVVSDARNRGELVILASTGVAWRRVVGVVLIIGLLGGAVSLAISGVLSPLARYAGRIKMAELRSEHIVAKIEATTPVSSVQTIKTVTFVATPPEDGLDRRGQLFVFQPDVDGRWRTIQARDWTVTGPGPEAERKIELNNLAAYEGDYPDMPAAQKDVSRFEVAAADFTFRMADITQPPVRERTKAERILNISPDETPRIAKLATRALMVPMAAMLALAALVAGGAGVGRYIALPVATLLLMTGDILARLVITGVAESWPPVLVIVAAFALYLGPPLAYLRLKGEALMIPSGRRS